MHYGADYYFGNMAMSPAAYVMVSRLRAQKLQPYIKPTDSVFEFGVGSGLNLAMLACAVRDGFDVNLSSSEEATRQGIQVFGPEPPSDKSYDVVICHHVLEHLRGPTECLTYLRQRLRSGGKLLLFTPYEEQRRYRRYLPSDKNYHFYSWTPHTLANLVIECGFKLQDARLGVFGYDRLAARLAAKLRLGYFGFRAIRWFAHLILREREVCVVATGPD